VNILEFRKLRTGQYRVHFDPFSDRKVPTSPARTAEIESDLFDLSGSYLGECRNCKRHILGESFKIPQTKFDAAEVSVVSQVNGGMVCGQDIFKVVQLLVRKV
jgi:hypothetical protein